MSLPEVVVVLGCRTLDDGSPKPAMVSRVKKGVEIYHNLASEKESGGAVLILTGYQGENQVITEAKAMEKLAIDFGVPSEHIYLEEKATHTEGNAYHSKVIIDQLQADYVHVVTSNFHLKRAQAIFEKVYPSPGYEVKYHGSESHLTDNEREKRSKLEDLLFHSIDHNLKYLAYYSHPDDKPLTVLQSEIIPSDLFTHGFTTRFGGSSTFPSLSSLNMVYNPNRKDPRLNIDENRMRLASQFGFASDQFVFPVCVHGCTVYVIGKEKPESYDAIVTNEMNKTLVAPGGDCIQMLFCDPVKKVIAAAHSGWRGTIAKISQEVINTMKGEFKCDVGNICVALGPSIGPCCFEVGDDVAERFATEISKEVVIRKEGAEKATVDLWKCSRMLLEEVGVQSEHIDDRKSVTLCTVCDEEKRFFSYRRDGIQFGTQIGFISLKSDKMDKKENQEPSEEEKCMVL